MIERLREAWDNAYYRWYGLYVSVLVTLIFGFQMYRYFVVAPAKALTCEHPSAIILIPVIGAFLNG